MKSIYLKFVPFLKFFLKVSKSILLKSIDNLFFSKKKNLLIEKIRYSVQIEMFVFQLVMILPELVCSESNLHQMKLHHHQFENYEQLHWFDHHHFQIIELHFPDLYFYLIEFVTNKFV